MTASASSRAPVTGPGRPAFITGGSSGIGLALAGLLAAEGSPLALFARDADKLSSAVEHLRKSHPDCVVETFPVDVSDRDACLSAVEEATRRIGPPALAIANAGIAEPGLFLEQSLDSHDRQISVNYSGALYFAHGAARAMAESGGGQLVFVSSGAAFFGIYGYSAYAPSKFALRGLAEVLRVELAEARIGVTLVYPPDTDTPQLAAEKLTKPAVTSKITEDGGLWAPEDVARKILQAARKNRFEVAPGFQMAALLRLHSLISPALRLWQRGIARKLAGRR